MTDVSPGTFLLGILNHCISSLILLWYKVSQASHVERPYGEVLRKQLTDEINVVLCMHACVLSHVQLFATRWAVAHQAPLSMGFPRQEYWGGLPLPPPGDLPDPGIEPKSLVFHALAGGFFTTSATWVKATSVTHSS